MFSWLIPLFPWVLPALLWQEAQLKYNHKLIRNGVLISILYNLFMLNLLVSLPDHCLSFYFRIPFQFSDF